MKVRVLAIILGLFISYSVCGQIRSTRRYFNSIDIRNGLSQNSVNAIVQDHKGYIWVGTKDGLNRFDAHTFSVFRNDPDNLSSLRNNFVRSLYVDLDGMIWVGSDAGLYVHNPKDGSFVEVVDDAGFASQHSIAFIYGDKSGEIWVGIDNCGLYLYDARAKKLRQCSLPDVKANVNCMSIDHSGTIWLGTFGDGLYYSKDNLRTLSAYKTSGGTEPFSKDVISCIQEGRFNRLYVGSIKSGIKQIDLTTNHMDDVLPRNVRGDNLYVRSFIFNSDKEIWIGTESGIYVHDLQSKATEHYDSRLDDPYSLSDNAVYVLFKDRDEGIWIGSYFGGLNYLSPQNKKFEKYFPQQGLNSLSGKRVREFAADKQGMLWIGTEDGGLDRFDPRTRKFSFVEASRDFTNVHGICMDGDKVWVGTFSKGLKVLDSRTGRVIREFSKEDKYLPLNDNHVFTVYRTSGGEILIGTVFGLMKYDPSGVGGFREIPELKSHFVYDIREDYYGDVWLATYANGVFRYDIAHSKWTRYSHDNSQDSLPSNKVLSIFEDSNHQIWITTQGGGFCKYLRDSNKFVRYSSKQGLPNNVVHQIVEDASGLFWITTNNGLVKFDPSSGVKDVYTTDNGLLCDQFNYKSSYRAADGKIYFGSTEGFISFDPTSLEGAKKSVARPEITEFSIFNRLVSVNDPDSPLSQSIDYCSQITLAANKNSFSFRVSSFNFETPNTTRFEYMLKGFDSQWFSVPASRVITYSNLSHGTYPLSIRVSDGSGGWSENIRTLKIVIRPPFYLTTVAKIFYFLFTVTSTLFFLRVYRRRITERHQIDIEHIQQQKEREIYDAKINFFTNIAHEIRTPLTLIRGPLDNCINKEGIDPEIRDDLRVMEQNTERLITLANQLLDFRKIESESFSLNFSLHDIILQVNNTVQRFSPLYKQRGIKIEVNIPTEPLWVLVDHEAFEKMISNLMNNAAKYALGKVILTLEAQESEFIVTISNDGPLIPQSMHDEVFRPFFRMPSEVSPGTGIGLPLSRSLAELHGGSIVIRSDESLNIFVLTIPINKVSENESLSTIGMNDPLKQDMFSESDIKTNPSHTVLIVEDDESLRAFLAKKMSETYSVLIADSGKMALEVLARNEVDIIVSDIMMPGMDGFELCRTIKSDINFSHIPLVLLTAQINIQSKIQALELGADAYVDKPFSVSYLIANIASLLNNRSRLREFYALSPYADTKSFASSKADGEFLRKMNTIIQKSLSNPEFNIDEIAEELCMSRSSFYRKIKGVINMNPHEYLRIERLKKAVQLMKAKDCQINDVCYQVGFTSPSYFSKCFLKQFGISPKDFLNNL